MLERTLELIEGTTRCEQINCKDQNGVDFDFEGYEVRTWLSFKDGMYVPTIVVGSQLNYEIPASASIGARNAVAETRIFKDGKVFEIFRLRINIVPSKKPDLTPVAM